MRRLATILVLSLLTLFSTGAPAFAHNVLVGSDPADGAQLTTGPDTVRLTFDQPVRAGYNTVTLVGPNGDHWVDAEPTVEGTSVTAPVRELGPAGRYTLAYRVLSNDGHPVSGKVTFSVSEAGNGTPAPPPENSADQDAGQEGSSVPIWPFVLGAVVLVALGLVLALRLGKPKA